MGPYSPVCKKSRVWKPDRYPFARRKTGTYSHDGVEEEKNERTMVCGGHLHQFHWTGFCARQPYPVLSDDQRHCKRRIFLSPYSAEDDQKPRDRRGNDIFTRT